MKPERLIARSGHELLSQSDVEAITEREPRAGSAVLSVYLDTDQSQAVNLKRGFEVVFKDMLRKVELPEEKSIQQEFKEDAALVLRFLNDYRDTRRALVVFCDASESFFWVRDLAINVRNILRWNERPFVRPLLELIDEHERYGLVLADRNKARLFTIFLGEIEEHKEAFAQADVKHIKTSGTDHLRSQMQIQRKADLHALWHLKAVSKTISRLAQKRSFDRLILGGPVEATNELFGLLSEALRARVVSRVALPVKANTEQVLGETLKIEAEVERQREVDLVESLIRAARKKEKAVLGLEETLLALHEMRLWQLVFSESFDAKAGQCTNCQSLLPSDVGPCVYCGRLVRAINDLIQIAVDRVMDLDGKVEHVRGPAAARLNEVGGLGALLHY